MIVSPASNAASERTEVFEKFEDILACALGVLSKIRKSHDLCLDRWGPSVVLGTKVVKDGFIAVHNRGAKIRLITEIASVNIGYCKEFMKFAEVRHLDKIRGNFSISDGRWYTASALAEKDKPPPRLIYSTVKEIANQHRYFFENLWNRAVPAEQRIAEIEGRAVAEKTEITYGEENSINLLTQVMDRTKKEAIACSSSVIPIFLMNVEPVKKKIIEAKARGVRPRQITEITKENLPYCKEFMEYVELRHMDNIQGNMVVTDNDEYIAAASASPSSVPHAIYSNTKTIIEQQRLFFENLWSKAVTAEQKIKELEEGIEPEFVEVITDGSKAASIMVDFAKSVRHNAQIILPIPKAMQRAKKMEIWNHLIEASNLYGADIQIISPVTEENADLAKEITSKAPKIRILPSPTSTTGMFIQDEQRYFRAEYAHVEATEFSGAISNILYSNSKSGVKWFKAFFETLWKQSELYEQLRLANEKVVLHDRMQQEFINIAAHELRTPIQPILGVIEMLKINFPVGEDKTRISKEEIEMLSRNAKRLERLSSDILQVTRIESGRLTLQKEVFDLNQKVSNVLNDARTGLATTTITTTRKKIDLIFEPTPATGEIRVQADKPKIFEVIFNLLHNSMKFTPDGGKIVVRTDVKDDRAIVTITDNGIGIDPAIMPRLFTRFSTKSERGTGLGLYISKSIIETHGGKIWAENNKDGKGATFTFTLPLATTL